ncbi:polysaccharide pyruvyl transferase family protein [Candidatus Beckwithbacteria bacterium]|nr:polysaccharide pyruvyl transferase family protein [Candidatus Beckwithbacteria bacterium]
MIKRAKYIILVGANFNSYNRGVGALSYATIDLVREKYPKAQFTILKLHHVIQNRKLENCDAVYFSKVELIFYFLLSFLKIKIGKIQKFIVYDLVIDLGEGDSFTDMYEIKRIIALTMLKVMFKNWGLKVLMFPQTIGPFRTLIGKILAKWGLEKVDKIYVRGQYSYNLVKNLFGYENKMELASDMGFLLKPQIVQTEIFTSGQKYIGINISGLLLDSKERFSLLQKEFDYEKLIDNLITFFLKKNFNLVLVSHTYALDRKIPFDDLRACKYFAQKFNNKRIFLIKDDYNSRELKYLISKCEFFVGSRMHACIAAASTFVPLSSIAYSHKFLGVFAQLGILQTVANPKEMTEEECFTLIKNNFKDRARIKQILHKNITREQKQAQKVLASL